MDERLVTELETAIADTGALLVRVQKYRRGTEPDAAELGRAALALGDTARRLNRRGTLDDATALALRGDAEALTGRVRELLAGIHGSREYVGAVAAYAAGDQTTLAALVPQVFAGIEPVPEPPDLFAPVTWRRRNRPRAAADVVADVARAREHGLDAEGDDVSPGADAALPAVVVSPYRPGDEPVVLRFAAGTLAVPVYRLAESGEHLVYVPRLRAPLVVELATALAPDALESEPADYARWRRGLAEAFAAAGIAFESS